MLQFASHMPRCIWRGGVRHMLIVMRCYLPTAYWAVPDAFLRFAVVQWNSLETAKKKKKKAPSEKGKRRAIIISHQQQQMAPHSAVLLWKFPSESPQPFLQLTRSVPGLWGGRMLFQTLHVMQRKTCYWLHCWTRCGSLCDIYANNTCNSIQLTLKLNA